MIILKTESSFSIAYNGFGLCVRAGFGAQNCQPAPNLNKSTKLQVCTSPRLTQNPCYPDAKPVLCGRLSISVSCFIVNYSNLFLPEWVDILLSRSYNKRNSRLVLALKLSCNFHTRKSIGKRLSA